MERKEEEVRRLFWRAYDRLVGLSIRRGGGEELGKEKDDVGMFLWKAYYRLVDLSGGGGGKEG